MSTDQQLVETLPDFEVVQAATLLSELKQLLSENLARIEDLSKVAAPDWDSLAAPMMLLADKLERFWAPVSHLNSVANTPALRDAYNSCLPVLSDYSAAIGQNRTLFEAWSRLAVAHPGGRDDSLQGLGDPAQEQARRKVIENTLRDFRLAGVDLNAEQQARFRVISSRLSELGSAFSNNVLDATQSWFKHFEDVSALKGLPESAVAAARAAAEDRKLEGWVATLDFPSYHAIITYAEDRALRKEIYEAYTTRASDSGPQANKWDNTPLLPEILRLRREKSELLGYADYTELSLATKMARKPEDVLQFLEDLARRSLPRAKKELQSVREFAKAQGADELEAWDLSFWSERLKQSTYAISSEELKPYFPVGKVLEGLFALCETLFDVRFESDENVGTYHPDVRFYRLVREGKAVAAIYMDLFARSRKIGGAWMAPYATRCALPDARIQVPVAFICANFSPATPGKPALLTHTEVVTLFHEMGHALHHLCTQVDVYEVSGINGVPWDAVELPSQFMENWCWERESVSLMSEHYQTGEPLPEFMLDKLLAARNFQSGLQMCRQLEFALFDFRLHREYRDQDADFVQQVLDQVRTEVAPSKVPAFNRFQHAFSHIFAGGYAAGYYSYKWAEVLSADAFSLFEERGILDAETGRKYRDIILARGGSEEPAVLFRAFRGRDPDPSALLRHTGIEAA